MTKWEDLYQEAQDCERRAWRLKEQSRQSRCPFLRGYEGKDQCILDLDHEGDHVPPKPVWVKR